MSPKEGKEENGDKRNLPLDSTLKESVEKIKAQLEEMSSNFFQVNPCSDAEELKRKIILTIEKFYKDMTVLNREVEKYKLIQKNREAEIRRMRVSPQRRCLGINTLSFPKWKHVLWIFLVFYVFVIFGLTCYIIFVDSTFIIETMICKILGRQRMWQLKELLNPFLLLEVDDLLPC
ncbi:single-pass membrane and coiled-coil domain-containing protein 2 isoform X2 [Notamacropus eugenii]|uniref:single-pass membrane and coiled-coil domain-containing protein 2 isoform X2 n=1 Tax=Notamacropus eugenii TaxID=9315 RepID=UPI003B66EA13